MSEKGVELTPTDDQLADDSHSNHADTMDVDHDNNQDRAQFEGEKSTLREAMPDHDDDERNSSRKAFPERPSEALLKGEKRTLEKAMPGQPSDEDSYGE